MSPSEVDAQKVEIDRHDNEAVSPAIVHELDSIFSEMPTVDRVALASLLLKLTGRVKKVERYIGK